MLESAARVFEIKSYTRGARDKKWIKARGLSELKHVAEVVEDHPEQHVRHHGRRGEDVINGQLRPGRKIALDAAAGLGDERQRRLLGVVCL